MLVNSDWPVIQKLWITDLSGVYHSLIDTYADKGPSGYARSNMMMTYLLNILIAPMMSLTKWIDELKRVPLYVIISGFELNKTHAISINTLHTCGYSY